MSLGLGLSFWNRPIGGGGWPPSITSSDGDPASLFDNGNDTLDVIVDGVTVGTITRAQVESGGFIEVAPPVVGMSGNNVVLTTTGYVIYVGDTPIESDVEVLADGVVVGTALPFDATAYPDATLSVNFSFSVGTDDLTIETTARLAPLKLIQFRDSFVATGTAWPLAQYRRKATVVMRISGTFSAATFRRFMLGLVNFYVQSTITVQLTSGTTNLGSSITVAALSASPRSISLMTAIDLDAGLPGGKTFVVWASINGGAPVLLGDSTATTTGNLDPNRAHIGSTASNTAGPDFDLHNHLWMSNVALDPAVHFGEFFESNGAVKRLPFNGVVQGATPVIFMIGDDFTTGNNRGSGTTPVTLARTPVTVINA